MGRRKKVTVIEEAPEAAEVGEPTPAEAAAIAAEEEKELEDQLQAGEWLTEFQSRFTDQPVKILVEKYDEAGDWAVCRKFPLANFDPDSVRLEFGSGRYRCTLFDPNGKWVKGGRTHFKFAEPVVKPLSQNKPENPLENPIVAMMLNAQKESTTMLMGIMQSLLTAQSAPGAGKGSTMTEVVETVKAINSMAPKDKPLDTLKEQLGLFKLVKEITGDNDGESKGGLLSDLKEVIEVLPLLKEHMAALKPQTAPAAPQITPGKVENMDPLSKKIVELVPKFIGGARANAPVPEWGSYLLDVFDTEVMPLAFPVLKEKFKALVKTEDDAFDLIIKLAADPDERANAIKQIPPLMPYLPWVNQVIDEAIRLAEAPEIETATGGSSILEAVAANGAKKPDETK
jgi:hypothetical protein